MNGKVRLKGYQFDRRQLLKMTGSMGLGLAFINPEKLLASGECTTYTNPLDPNQPVIANPADLYYWIDGMHYAANSNLPSRATVATFINYKQEADDFVERVVLTDENDQILGAFEYDASTRMHAGFPPYAVFENIEINPARAIKVFYQVSKGSDVIVYLERIASPLASSLSANHLPAPIRNDFSSGIYASSPGQISSVFQYYTHNGAATHSARAKIVSISSSSNEFRIDVDHMHGDSVRPSDDPNETDPLKKYGHYMRYFIIADPVGRILGVVKRDYTGGNSGAVEQVTQLSQDQIQQYEMQAKDIADIRDCPYVQVFTEDHWDAMARATYKIR